MLRPEPASLPQFLQHDVDTVRRPDDDEFVIGLDPKAGRRIEKPPAIPVNHDHEGQPGPGGQFEVGQGVSQGLSPDYARDLNSSEIWTQKKSRSSLI